MKSLLKTKNTKYFFFFGILFFFFLISGQVASAGTYYWVGADGANVNVGSNWSTSSGGGGGSTVPGLNDSVIFDGGGNSSSTISASWTVSTVEIKVTYTKAITQNTGTTWTINSTFLNSSTATVYSGSGTATITFDHSSRSPSITPGGITFNNLTLYSNDAANGIPVTTITGTFTIAGNLTISHGGSSGNNGHAWKSTAGASITLLGNFSQSSNRADSIPFFGESITLYMTGESKSFTRTRGQTRGTVYLNGTGTTTINTGWNNPGSWQFGAGETMVVNPTSGIAVLGAYSYFYNLNINAGKTLDTSPNGGTNVYNMYIWNSMTNQAGAVFTARTGTVTFDHSTGNPSITPGGITFNNLSLYSDDGANGIPVTTITGTFTITGNLSISNGGSGGNNGHAWKSTAGASITVQGNYSQSSNRADSIPFFGENMNLYMTGENKSFTRTHGQTKGTVSLNGTGTTTLSASQANPASWQYGVGETMVVNPASGAVVLGAYSYFYNLNINAGKTLDTSPNGGTNVYNLYIWNSMTNQAGAVFTARTGTVTFDHSSRGLTITPAGITFNNLTLTAAGQNNDAPNGYTTTLSGAFTVAGTLSVTTTSGNNALHTWNGSSCTITLQGSFNMSQSGTALTFGSGITTNMTGVGKTFTVSSGAFVGNITFAGTGTTSVNKAGTATGGTATVNQASGSVVLAAASTFYVLTVTTTLDLAGYNLTSNSTFTLGAASTLRMTGGEASVTTPTFTAGSTVEYYGSASVALKNWSYKNLTINSASTTAVLSLPAALSIATTTITSGVLSLAGYNLTSVNMVNNNTLKLKGSEVIALTNAATGTGTFEYVGDADSVADTYTLNNLNYTNLKINPADATDAFNNNDPGTWTRQNSGDEVFGLGRAGSFDSTHVGYPSIIADTSLTTPAMVQPYSYGVLYNGTTQMSTVGGGTGFTNGWTALTMSLWVYITTWTDYPVIIGTRDSAGRLNGIAMGSSGVIQMYTDINSTQGWGGGKSGVSTGAWHHVVYRWSTGNTADLFVDGTKYVGGSYSGSITQNTSALVIGHDPSPSYPNSRFLNGKADEVGIWNRALTDAEVVDLYAADAGRYTDPGKMFPSTGTSMATNLQILYHADENASTNLYDASGNARTGTLGGTYTTGKTFLDTSKGYELYFNGSASSTFATTPTNASFSTSFWMKASSTQANDTPGVLYNWGDNNGFKFEGDTVAAATSTMYFRIGDATGTTTMNFPAVFDNNWHHIVVTYDGVTLSGYKDNVSVGSVPWTKLNTSGTTFLLGYGNTGTTYYKGYMDELLYFSRAITASEVSTLYAGGTGLYGDIYASPTNSGLTYGWHFDTGGTTMSSFATANNGTLRSVTDTSTGEKGYMRASTYKMWYNGHNGGQWAGIGFALSNDGIHWEKMNETFPVLSYGAAGKFDAGAVLAPSVIKDGSTYKMWYSGYLSNWAIGYATSPDGFTWTKQNSGNLVLDKGAAGKFDAAHAYTASVLKESDTDYRIWYSGHNGSYIAIGYATSTDGISWTKQNSGNSVIASSSGKFDSTHLLAPFVLKDGSTYKMWYSGHNGTTWAGIGYASSSDGLTWVKQNSGNVVVGLGAAGKFDASSVLTDAVIKEGNTFKMWYTGVLSNYKIGYATSYLTLPTLTVRGGLTINNGSFSAPLTLNLAGNLTKTGGTFTNSSGTLNLNGLNQIISLDATTTFYNLTKSVTATDTLTFAASSTAVITGATTLNGVEGGFLSLRSTASGTQWMFDPQGARTLAYLDVKDSFNINAATITATNTALFTNSGNNTGWDFTLPSSPMSIGKSGTQIATTSISLTPTTKDMGGAFTFIRTTGTGNVTSIVLKQAGSLPTAYISNLQLFYKTETNCSATKPAGTTLFGTGSAFVSGLSTTTGTMPVTTSNICLYINYDLTGASTESLIGYSIDFQITNPSTDVLVSAGSAVSTTGPVNVSGRTIIVDGTITNSLLSLRMTDQTKDPTVFYLKDNAVWKREGSGAPIRLTNPNLQVQSLAFTNLTGLNSAGTVKMQMTVSNVNIGAVSSFLNVTKTYSTTATVKTWSGSN